MENLLINRRKMLKKTQIDIFIETGISEKTIRNFEKYMCQPSLKIIEKLSLSYNLNPNILIKYDNYKTNLLDIDDVSTIINEFFLHETLVNITDLIKIYKDRIIHLDESTFEALECIQYLEFLYGLNNIFLLEHDKAINNFIKAFKYTIPNFNIKDISYYLNYVCSLTKMEIRILYELSNALYYTDSKNTSYLVIEKIIEKINTKWIFYREIICKYSINLSRQNRLDESLKLITKAIEFSHSTFIYKNLSFYYFNRAVIRKKLSDPNFYDDINKALEICKVLNLKSCSELIKNKCDKFNI